jgi:hypothetical protein
MCPVTWNQVLSACSSRHGLTINGNDLSRRAILARPSGVQDHETSEAVCVQDTVSEWPSAARRHFRGGYH